MTQDDAMKMMPAVAGIDSGCPVCIEYFLEKMRELFPEVDWDAAVRTNEDVLLSLGEDDDD